MRSTDEIHYDITAAYTRDGSLDHAELGRLWREMAAAATREGQRSLVLAAALLAGDHEDRARRDR